MRAKYSHTQQYQNPANAKRHISTVLQIAATSRGIGLIAAHWCPSSNHILRSWKCMYKAMAVSASSVACMGIANSAGYLSDFLDLSSAYLLSRYDCMPSVIIVAWHIVLWSPHLHSLGDKFGNCLLWKLKLQIIWDEHQTFNSVWLIHTCPVYFLHLSWLQQLTRSHHSLTCAEKASNLNACLFSPWSTSLERQQRWVLIPRDSGPPTSMDPWSSGKSLRSSRLDLSWDWHIPIYHRYDICQLAYPRDQRL